MVESEKTQNETIDQYEINKIERKKETPYLYESIDGFISGNIDISFIRFEIRY